MYKIEQIYTGCLAQGAYYIHSGNEAIIIDPLREVKPYIERAKKDGVTIRYIFETHFHADFVSGHLDLAKQTGAPIVFGPNAEPAFDAVIAHDGQEFTIGDIKLKVLHTPGHTFESSCYLLIDEKGDERALFTGDTLFIGDVGRPDLAQKGTITQDDLAGMLFDSLRKKVMVLSDSIIIYPAHGAGSACGKNMSSETQDTLGNQKKFNYALRADMTREEFIREVTEGLSQPPAYFPFNVAMNKQGYESIETILQRGNKGLSPDEFEALANETGALLLDVRDAQTFAKAFVPNSVFIGIDGQFAPWVGALIPDIKQPILIVAPEGREEETVTRLSRVGYDNSIGYLKGGIEAWINAGKETDTIQSVTATEVASHLKNHPTTIIDVRKPGEYSNGHIEGVENAPLDFLNDSMISINKDEPVYVHCAGGYRSMIFTSILRARGYKNLMDVKGGFKEILQSGLFTITNATTASA